MRQRHFRLAAVLILVALLCVSCAAVSGITGLGEEPAASVPKGPSGRKIPLPPTVQDFQAPHDGQGS